MPSNAVLLAWPCLVACILAAGAETQPAVSYNWQSGQVYRFDYSKTITVEQPDATGNAQSESSGITGVLIIEIRSVSATGASGVMRIDAPRVTLPEIRLFSSQYNAPELQKGKNEVLALAIQSAIKNARWNVTLDSRGRLRIEGRTPASFREWMKDVENTAGWRKKSIDKLARLVEDDLGLKAKGEDVDLLPSLQRSAGSNANESEATNVLRPRRDQPKITTDGEKAKAIYKRLPPEKQGAYLVPDLSANERIAIAFKDVETSEGSGVFDTTMGMLDTFSEDFTATLNYSLGKLPPLVQKVRVQYKLRRLAPAIVKP